MVQTQQKVRNPFAPATRRARKLKVLVYGDTGVGKTMFGLSFPGVAMIDAEGGSLFYAGRPGIAPFHVLDSKDIDAIHAAIAFIEQDGGQTIQTLVIDPITVPYKILQDAAQQVAERRELKKDAKWRKPPEEVSLTYRDWGMIKREYGALMTRLLNLPVHVVLIARQKDEYEGTGDAMKKVGVKADVEKDTPYIADVVIRLEKEGKGRVGVVDKDRTGAFRTGERIPNISFASFAAVLDETATDAPAPIMQSETDAADRATRLFDPEEAPANQSTRRQRLIARVEQKMREADDSGVSYPPAPDFDTASDEALEGFGLAIKKAMDEQVAFLKAENVRKGTTPEGIRFE